MSDREELLNETYGPGTGWTRKEIHLIVKVPQRLERAAITDDALELVREILDDAAFDITADEFDLAKHDADIRAPIRALVETWEAERQRMLLRPVGERGWSIGGMLNDLRAVIDTPAEDGGS